MFFFCGKEKKKRGVGKSAGWGEQPAKHKQNGDTLTRISLNFLEETASVWFLANSLEAHHKLTLVFMGERQESSSSQIEKEVGKNRGCPDRLCSAPGFYLNPSDPWTHGEGL